VKRGPRTHGRVRWHLDTWRGGGASGPLTTSLPRKLPPHLRLLAFASVPVLLIAVATVGYRAIEPWSWFDAFYMAVATLTSIGSELHAVSTRGRLFTVVLALGGIFTVALTATEVLRTIITGELRGYLEKRRMEKRIARLKHHVIVCGYGRVGRRACADLLGAGIPSVVIDRSDVPLAAARDAGAHPVSGDAAADATLRQAGIDHARALVAAAGTDPENVLITMAARLLCPALPIVARAADESAVPKLLRAGASRTVSPYVIAGTRMAQAVLRPAVLDLIEVATRPDLPDLQLGEQLVQAGSSLDGGTVGASGLRSPRGGILVAIKRRGGGIAFNPDDNAAVAAGDILIILGGRAQLDHADQLARAR
jgi:voltage-gated potassium channel